MAADEIYEVKLHFENPSGSSSCRLFYQETIIRSGIGTDTQILAQSWDTALSALLRDVIADDFEFPSITCRKMDGDLEAKFRLDRAAPAGLRPGPALPSNNALLLGLYQGLFPARSNGRMFIPGIAEGDTLIGNLTSAFASTQVTALINGLVAQLDEESGGTGRWDLGVISTKVLDAAPPFKDWAGAFSPVSSVAFNPIVATQRRRQTRVVGAAV